MSIFRALSLSVVTFCLSFGVYSSPLAAEGTPPPAANKPQAAAPAAKALKPTAVLAEVNGKKITKADYDRTLDSLERSIARATGGNGRAGVTDAMKKDLVNQLVGKELIYQESLKFNPKDFSQKVDEQIKQIKATYPKPEAFQERLKSDGMTEKEFRELVSKEVSIRNYGETQIASKIKVSDAEAKAFYEENKAKLVEPEQVRASHVLILVPQGTKPEDKQKLFAKAKDIQKRAAKGEDFAKLATENSQDTGSAKSGGDLGFFTQDRMVEPFAKAAFALKPGQVSEVVETTYGYHVIKMTEKKPSHQQTFEEVKGKIVPYLQNQATSKALLAKVEELKKTAKIKVLIPNP